MCPGSGGGEVSGCVPASRLWSVRVCPGSGGVEVFWVCPGLGGVTSDVGVSRLESVLGDWTCSGQGLRYCD